MAQTRMVKTMLALVVCMTLGTFALVLMQTDPIRSPLLQLASVTTGPDSMDQMLRRTDVSLSDRWENIVIYRDGRSVEDPGRRFHFLVTLDAGEPILQATRLWNEQKPPRLPIDSGPADWNARSVAIYVQARQGRITSGQVELSDRLCRRLRNLCSIGLDHVYSSRDLPGLRD
jgi:hypothetical protein